MKTTGSRVVTAPYSYKNWSIATGKVKATVNASWYGNAKFSSTAGMETPGFAAMRRSGALLPFTPFAQVEEEWTSGGTSWDLRIPATDTITRASSDLTAVDLSKSVLAVGAADPEVLYTQLMAKMGRPDWDALTFAGELRRTINMFRDLLPKLRSFVKQYDKEGVRDMYLQVRYGLRPIVYDMMGINQAILRLAASPRNFIRKRVESITENTLTKPVVWGNITYDLRASTVVSARMSGVSSAVPPAIGVNPVVTVWELTWLSFILDWVVDVGTFLEALTSASAYGETLCGFGILQTSQVSIVGSRITDPSKASGSVSMGGNYILQQTSRAPYGGRSLSVPLQFDIDFWKVVDLVFIANALMRVQRRNPPKACKFYYRSKRPVHLPDIIYTGKR